MNMSAGSNTAISPFKPNDQEAFGSQALRFVLPPPLLALSATFPQLAQDYWAEAIVPLSGITAHLLPLWPEQAGPEAALAELAQHIARTLGERPRQAGAHYAHIALSTDGAKLLSFAGETFFYDFSAGYQAIPAPLEMPEQRGLFGGYAILNALETERLLQLQKETAQQHIAAETIQALQKWRQEFQKLIVQAQADATNFEAQTTLVQLLGQSRALGQALLLLQNGQRSETQKKQSLDVRQESQRLQEMLVRAASNAQLPEPLRSKLRQSLAQLQKLTPDKPVTPQQLREAMPKSQLPKAARPDEGTKVTAKTASRFTLNRTLVQKATQQPRALLQTKMSRLGMLVAATAQMLAKTNPAAPVKAATTATATVGAPSVKSVFRASLPATLLARAASLQSALATFRATTQPLVSIAKSLAAMAASAVAAGAARAMPAEAGARAARAIGSVQGFMKSTPLPLSAAEKVISSAVMQDKVAIAETAIHPRAVAPDYSVVAAAAIMQSGNSADNKASASKAAHPIAVPLTTTALMAEMVTQPISSNLPQASAPIALTSAAQNVDAAAALVATPLILSRAPASAPINTSPLNLSGANPLPIQGNPDKPIQPLTVKGNEQAGLAAQILPANRSAEAVDLSKPHSTAPQPLAALVFVESGKSTAAQAIVGGAAPPLAATIDEAPKGAAILAAAQQAIAPAIAKAGIDGKTPETPQRPIRQEMHQCVGDCCAPKAAGMEASKPNSVFIPPPQLREEAAKETRALVSHVLDSANSLGANYQTQNHQISSGATINIVAEGPVKVVDMSEAKGADFAKKMMALRRPSTPCSNHGTPKCSC